jgi:hypothetical protein
MNRVIKELIQKADSICNETRGVYDEILVELIIRECAKLVRKHNYQTIQNEEPLYGITSSEILEHFGVEE